MSLKKGIVEVTSLEALNANDVIDVKKALNIDEVDNTVVSTNTAKVSADGSVTTHNDVTSAGSGQIISSAERAKLNGIETGAEVNNFEKAGSNLIETFWSGTQAEYDAIENKSNTTIYFIE